MKIVFMGTPDFAVPSLTALLESGHEILAVFTQPDKPKGRGHKLQAPPVKELAVSKGIPVFQPATLRTPEAAEVLRKLDPELIVVAAYGKLLPPEVLHIPPRGCINVHGSILPKYRGAAPIQWAVLNGDKTTGVTIQQMAEGMDTGDILTTVETPIGENETSGELFDRLKILGAELLIKTIEDLENIQPQAQNDAEATHAPMIRKEMAQIDWTRSAEKIHDLVRGMSPWPVAFCTLGEKRVKVFSVRVVNAKGEPGEIILQDGEMTVCCGENALQILEMQPENGKRMRGADYLRGHTIDSIERAR